LILFKKLDQDGSGALNGAELKTFRFILKRKFGFTAEEKPLDSPLRPTAFSRLLAEAEAQHVPIPVERFFQKADRDRSGTIEGEELDFVSSVVRKKAALPAAEYAKLEGTADADGNGKLAPVELKHLFFGAMQASPLSHMHPLLAVFFRRGDKNADGAIAGAEEAAFLSRALRKKFQISPEKYSDLLKEADAGGDGRLEPMEFKHLVRMARREGGQAQTRPQAMVAQHLRQNPVALQHF
jgi:Ca2+-binding EF-hand superfamily protein